MRRETAHTPQPTGSLAVFHYKNFRHIWTVSALTSTANWVQQVALGWYAFHVTNSAFLTGAILALRALPFLLVGPLSGAMADRFDRQRVVAAFSLFGAVAVVGFGLLLTFDQVDTWHIFVFSFLGGVSWAAIDSPRHAIVGESVPSSLIGKAVAHTAVAQNVMRALGPAVGGYMIAFVRLDATFYVQAAIFLSVIPLALAIVLPSSSERPRRLSLLANVREGFVYVRYQPIVLGLILTTIAPFFFLWAFLSGLMPVFTEAVLHRGADTLGLLFSMTGIGGVAGTLAVALLPRLQVSGRVLFVSGILAGVSLALFPLTTWLPLSIFLLFLVGVFQFAYLASNNTLLQTVTPSEYRARVMSIYLVSFGLTPGGTLLAGAMADAIGSRWAMVFAGVAVAVSLAAIAVAFPNLWRLSAAREP